MLKGNVLVLTKQKINKKDGGKMILLEYMCDNSIHKSFINDPVLIEQYDNIPIMQEVEADFKLSKYGENTNITLVDFKIKK
jgi:hypothetical protein